MQIAKPIGGIKVSTPLMKVVFSTLTLNKLIIHIVRQTSTVSVECEFKTEFNLMWELLSWEFGLVQKITSDPFLRNPLTPLGNKRLWSCILSTAKPTDSTANITQIAFTYVTPYLCDFVYDSNFRFSGRIPLGFMTSFPDQEWAPPFFHPLKIQLQENHFYFVPSLDKCTQLIFEASQFPVNKLSNVNISETQN